jgi:Protein of unknown function (DUF4242)
MRKFIIEREITGIGKSTAEELSAAAQRSNRTLKELGSGIQWVHSYVTPDRTFCVYLAEDEELIRAHAGRSGFPATRITEVCTTFDPSAER